MYICRDMKKSDVFVSSQSQEIIKYVRQHYHNDLEFLWVKLPLAAVWRNSASRKWYGVMMILPRSKIGLSGDGVTEVLNLHAEPAFIDMVVDRVRFFPGYHMNKRHWLTICLDGSIATDDVIKLLDASFALSH